MTSRFSMFTTLKWLSLLLLPSAILNNTAITSAQTTSEDTCNINGRLYSDRERIDLTTRCGSADDFPCVCNPNLSGQVECPYCGFATYEENGGSALLCATNNQQVTFLNVNQVSQTCSCQIPQPFSTPISSCVPTEDLPPPPPTEDNTADTCLITVTNGSMERYNRGDFITGLTTRCGPDFPCICNPNVNGQIECPFCSFATNGGGLACAHDDESVFFTNSQGNELTCSCQMNSNDMANPVTNCVPGAVIPPQLPTPSPVSLPVPTPVPNNAPSAPILWPIFAPTIPPLPTPSIRPAVVNPPSAFSPIAAPSLPSTAPSFRTTITTTPVPIIAVTTTPTPPPTPRPSLRPGVDANDRCQLEHTNEDGSMVVLEFARGESYQDYLSTRCGPGSEFPCFCNPDNVPHQMECPYCSFALSNGDLVCSRHDEMVTFQDNDMWQTCSCDIIPGNGAAPARSCQVVAPPTLSPSITTIGDATTPTFPPTRIVDPIFGPRPTSAPTTTTTDDDGCLWESSSVGSEEEVQVVTLTRGQSFGPLLDAGPCGDAVEWPYICNPNVAGGREYPYCEFTTSLGDVLCAKDDHGQNNNNPVEFVDVHGDPQSCTCSYFNPALGPQGICHEWKLPTESPSKKVPFESSPPVTTTTDAPTTSPTILVVPPDDDDSNDANSTKTKQAAASEDFSLSLSKSQVILISVGLSVALMICVLLSIFYLKKRKTYEEY